MSEPVAWVYVNDGGDMEMSLSSKCPGYGYKPLYDSKSIARKDEAISELAGVLRKLQYAYRQIAGLHDPNTDDVFTVMTHNTIAKYDNTTEKRK